MCGSSHRLLIGVVNKFDLCGEIVNSFRSRDSVVLFILQFEPVVMIKQK